MLLIKQKSKYIVHASATTSAVTIGKNTYDVVNAIRNRNKKPEVEQSAEDNLLNALKSGKGFQYV